ncbi:MAG: RDD family protein, partial [Thermoplasmata archaeon]|nr:RDD family protein [Thermoplasmata archaeon]
WARRVIAFAVDLVLVTFPVWIVLQFVPNVNVALFGLLSGLSLFTYSSLFETYLGKTPGKNLMSLRVESTVGDMSLVSGILRSIAKFFWYIFPLIDTLLGMATDGDPRQRLTDRVANTVVVRVAHVPLRKVRVKRAPVPEE